jgi:hypothetical protein
MNKDRISGLVHGAVAQAVVSAGTIVTIASIVGAGRKWH